MLGLEIRALRKSRGITLRQLAEKMGLRAHSNISDYEKGRRLPPNDILLAFERELSASPGQLARMRDRALAEEAHLERAEALRSLGRGLS